jgi:aminoglycoside phosphotransferase (APT) family kinase protein
VTGIDFEMPDGTTRRAVVREPGTPSWKGANPGAARREFELLAHLLAAGLPVPRPLLLDESPPHPFFVMDFIEGTRDLPADGAEALADTLARVHALPLPASPLLRDREDPIANIGKFLGPGHAALQRRLAGEPITFAPRRTLLHGDYWPGNVLWRSGELVTILDWEDAALGDPLSDVACCRLELRYVVGPTGAEAFTRRYAQQTQRPLDGLPIWSAYVAAAALASMSQWGLPAERAAHMRREAEASLAEAEARILGG